MSTMAVGASGARAAEAALGAVAHNVANLNTDGFQASQAAFADVAGGGVTTSFASSGGPAPLIARGDTFVRGSNTDLVADTVGRATAAATYRANLRTISESSDLVGSLLDIVG
ncbi:MAG: flagellar basal body protein [Myxococcota bacterium]